MLKTEGGAPMDDHIPELHGWTPAVLKQYVDQRFLDSDKAVSAALQAAKEAVGKAEVATDKRFDGLTEDADRRSRELSAQIKALETSKNLAQGSSSTSQRLQALFVPAFLSLALMGETLYLAIHK